MRARIVVVLAILAFTVSSLAGCKKKEETAEAPATSAAPATAPAPAAPSAPGATTTAGGKSGADLFKQYCASCHPDGGNTMNAKKTLHAADMAANNVKSADDVVKLIRNPGPGMPKLDATALPDADAQAIGEYVISTFK